MPVRLHFDTPVRATPEQAWTWISSLAGIRREMAPYLAMTAPAGLVSLSGLALTPGQPLFRSWILLFGILPVDRSDLTLIHVDAGAGFVEQSPMGSMRLWRHERRIVARGSGCRIVDALTFQPKFAAPVVARLVGALFSHRHRMLVRYLGQGEPAPPLDG